MAFVRLDNRPPEALRGVGVPFSTELSAAGRGRSRRRISGLTAALMIVAAAIVLGHAPQAAVAQTTRYDLPPKILVLRGAFEVFSLGMNDLTHKLAQCGYDVKVTSWSLALVEAQCSEQPIVVIGHSLGGRMCAWVSRKLMHCGYRVPLIIIVDANLLQPIPANVDRCLNLYVTNEFGVFHGSPVVGESPGTDIVNWDVSRGQPRFYQGGVNHFDIDATPWVHQIIIDEIAQTFPPPLPWTATGANRRGTQLASVAPSALTPATPSAGAAPSPARRRPQPARGLHRSTAGKPRAQLPRWRPDRQPEERPDRAPGQFRYARTTTRGAAAVPTKPARQAR